jgi:hypothetical protein
LDGASETLNNAATERTALKTFTSPDGVFQFKYPAKLVRCTLSSKEGWISGGCTSQGGVCDDPSSSVSTIVCFAYPKDEFEDKPEFSAAAFFFRHCYGFDEFRKLSEGFAGLARRG